MKNNNIFRGVLLMTVSVLSYTSCSSRDNGEVVTDEIEKVTLNINPNILEEDQIITVASASSKFTGSVGLHEVKEKMITGRDFDALVSSQIYNTSKINTIASSSFTGAVAATAKLGSGIKYLVRIYNDNAGSRGTQLGDFIFTVGQTNPTITVDGGKKYYWIAYSLNESTLPTLAVSNTVVNAPDNGNKDLLYASGNLTTVGGSNNLDINFKHKAVRIDVNLDSKGMFRPMSGNSDAKASLGTGNGTSFNSIIRQKAFNIETGSYYGSAGVTPEPTLGSDITAQKTVSFYSPDPVVVPANGLTVKLTNIHFGEYENLKFDRSSYLGIPNEAVNANPGDRYLVNAHLIQSAVNIGGVLWARDDVYNYSSTSYGMDGLRLNDLSNYNIGSHLAYSEYWNWNALNPTDVPNTGSFDQTKDPCRKLYPFGTWRLPTAAEAGVFLTKSPDNVSNTYVDMTRPGAPDNSYFYLYYTTTTGVPTTEYGANNGVMLRFNGYRPINYTKSMTYNGGGNAGWPYNVVNGQSHADGSLMFWTSDTGSVAGTAKAFVRKITFTGNGTTTTISYPAGSIQDVDRRTGLQIRCVRTVATPNT
ncbi:hypothetical protein PF438_04420 [Elizabethkingia meningoseptica]|uniref:hypothetical protein n=1 Tax=Elizabethkingia meningoseptica TaxID=238 RepID=UPI0022F1C2C6|nr:hypothetical protein [Elizabethkingia meningoseptica]EJK5330479.1 hypothetical protein [Elizabethkingia meningoseptica]WBS75738.1 hypothetical protein PF438_04420 [Elizabethkingia meningoseptica]